MSDLSIMVTPDAPDANQRKQFAFTAPDGTGFASLKIVVDIEGAMDELRKLNRPDAMRADWNEKLHQGLGFPVLMTIAEWKSIL